MKTITIKEALNQENAVFVDVRSQKEYSEDHIYGAVNIPLLDDEERAIIGTLYKQEGKEEAIDRGIDFVTPKIRELYVELKNLSQNEKEIIIYCSRGGMRSGSVAQLAAAFGLDVQKLEGGYKSYRNHVLNYLKDIEGKCKFTVLHGNTCVGKTDILSALEEEGLNTLDLEDLAKNSGSVFGHIYHEEEATNQKFFETQIFTKIKSLEDKEDKILFMESESKKIGRCTLSKEFWDMIQNGYHILVESSIKDRVNRSVKDYSLKSSNCDKKLIDSVYKLKDTLGHETTKLLEERVSKKDYAFVAQYLMENYYDRLYRHSEKKYTYEFSVCSDQMEETIKTIINWHKKKLMSKEIGDQL